MDFYALSLIGIYLPHLEKLRETGGFFQSPKLNLTVSHGFENLQEHVCTDLLVFASVNYSFDAARNVCY